MPRIAIIHTGQQDDFVVDVPAVSLSVLKDLLKRRLAVETHESLQIRPAKLTGSKQAGASGEAATVGAGSSTELAKPAGSAVVKAHAADAWDGSIDYIRGGKL